MQIGSIKNNQENYKNNKSQSTVQARRLENYSEVLKEVLEQYAEEIQITILAYNKKSCEETMMIKGLRKSSQETTNRKTHMENVEGIAAQIAKKLGLNVGVTRIMARNHDIGHTFLGHSGEWWMSNVKEEFGMGCYCHNALGPAELIYRHNIYEEILERIVAFNPDISSGEMNRIRRSLWLIFDGINSHNGEKTESEFIPKKEKDESMFLEELEMCFVKEGFDKTIVPATIEGCLIRLCDKISYIPYDLLDGLREGIIDEIDGEYIPVLNSLGITSEEIAECNERESYEAIARKLQILFTKDVIQHSSKEAIRMSPEISKPMHELRNINNRRIVKYAVLQEDTDTYPPAIKELMDMFSNVLLLDDNLERTRNASEDGEFARDIVSQYKGTIYEGFAKYIAGVTPAEYDFAKRIVERTSEGKENDEDTYPNLREKLSLEFGARYIATLNDFEFFDLLLSAGLITEEQAKSLTRKYKDIGQEGLKRELDVPKEFKTIMTEQVEETKKIQMQRKVPDDQEL